MVGLFYGFFSLHFKRKPGISQGPVEKDLPLLCQEKVSRKEIYLSLLKSLGKKQGLDIYHLLKETQLFIANVRNNVIRKRWIPAKWEV